MLESFASTQSWTEDNSKGLKLTECTKGWSCLWSWWIWLHSCSTQNLELAALSAAEKDNAMVDACKIFKQTQRFGWAAFYKELRVGYTVLIWEGQYCLHSLHNAMADAWKTPTACEHCVQPCTSRRQSCHYTVFKTASSSWGLSSQYHCKSLYYGTNKNLDDNVIQIQNLPTWACACMHSVFNHLTFTSLLVWIVREALIEKYILSLPKMIILIVEIAVFCCWNFWQITRYNFQSREQIMTQARQGYIEGK